MEGFDNFDIFMWHFTHIVIVTWYLMFLLWIYLWIDLFLFYDSNEFIVFESLFTCYVMGHYILKCQNNNNNNINLYLHYVLLYIGYITKLYFIINIIITITITIIIIYSFHLKWQIIHFLFYIVKQFSYQPCWHYIYMSKEITSQYSSTVASENWQGF